MMQDYNINQGPVKFTTLVDAPHPPDYQSPNHLGSSVSNNLNPFSNSGNNSGKSLVMGLVGGMLGNALYSYAMKKKLAGKEADYFYLNVDNAAVFLLGVGLVGMVSYKGIDPRRWF
tara:strand:- start:1131 stop:1478 length:348 start_codon:yes stop_codon:yes gene_type:complete